MRRRCPSHLVRCAVLALGIAGPATAGFVPADWTFGNYSDTWPNAELGIGQTVTIGSPLATVGGSGMLTMDAMTINGGNAGVKGVSMYSTIAAFTGTVTIEWHYLTADALCFDNGGYVVNNVFTAISCNNGPFLGSTTFSVNAGDTFGFGVRTGDGLAGPGKLIVTSFDYVPGPGAAAILGLLALPRRRRRG